MQAAVDEEERGELARGAERVARDCVERDVLEDLLWDRIERYIRHFFGMSRTDRGLWMLHGDKRATTTAKRGTRHLVGICHINHVSTPISFFFTHPRKYVACELRITQRKLQYIIRGQAFHEIP